MEAISIVISLLIVIGIIFSIIVNKLNSLGMDVKSFKDFIIATMNIEKLYNFAKRYDKLSYSEQEIFLNEAKKLFEIYENVPGSLWEEEYDRYIEILEKYSKIKNEKWLNNNLEKENRFRNLIAKELYNSYSDNRCVKVRYGLDENEEKGYDNSTLNKNKKLNYNKNNKITLKKYSNLKNEKGSITMKMVYIVSTIILFRVFLNILVKKYYLIIA